MCELCEKGWNNCEDCGVLVCLDYEMGDDIVRPARITDDGTILCDYHYKSCLEAEEAEQEEWGDYF